AFGPRSAPDIPPLGEPPAPPAQPPAPDAAESPAEPLFPAESPPSASPPKESWESKIGARWTVLVGGVALALGAVFLVRYSIQAGLLGPAARIAAGFLLSAMLFGGGEWLRRRDR